MGRDHLEGLSVDGSILFEWIMWKLLGKVWTGCVCLRVGTSGGLL
jgi:hypothetical protein